MSSRRATADLMGDGIAARLEGIAAGGATGRCAKQQAFAIRATGPKLHGLTSRSCTFIRTFALVHARYPNDARIPARPARCHPQPSGAGPLRRGGGARAGVR